MSKTKEFKAESKRLLDLMINSIYTNKEIFFRELISNASDAIDKIYYRALSDENLTFNQSNYYIRITPNFENRTLTISDTGIGMTKEEMEDNLGTIAKSGSLSFKNENESKDGFDIIGQFGVGFYSAFMVADKVTVISRSIDGESFKWESTGAEGYTMEPCKKDTIGTQITLVIKEDTDDYNYSDFLVQNSIRDIIKKYSDFIRYPIKMITDKSRPIEGSTSGEKEDYTEDETLNSMVPIWRKNKNELTAEDYEGLYSEKRYGFDKPLKYVHTSVDGAIRYDAILYIPEKTPFDFYTKEYAKGLELYSNGILIMNKCADLLPDYFSFVKGLIDSPDLSLNISREMLQQDSQLRFIAKKIKDKVKNELIALYTSDREKYVKFWQSFGKTIKYGLYSDYGTNKDLLEDLVMFCSSFEKKLVTLDEYIARMPEEQNFIYYVCGDSIDRMDKLPQTEMVKDKGYELLYFTDEIDEFAVRMLVDYKGKDFKSVSSGDLGFEAEDKNDASSKETEESKVLFTAMKDILADKVAEVRISKRLKTHPVCLVTGENGLSIEMEKVLSSMPDNNGTNKATKIMEINPNHEVYTTLQSAHDNDNDKFALFTQLLYTQALLIEGLPVEDPVAFSNDICKLMK